MRSVATPHKELTFLEELLGNKSLQYRSAYFLKSAFQAPKWHCDFGDRLTIDVDFAIPLYDKSLLSAQRNHELLSILKSWICVQTHPTATKGIILAPESAHSRVTRALRLADYILLHGKRFGIAEHGLMCITESNVAELVHDLSGASEAAESIYGWQSRLAQFLRTKISESHPGELDNLVTEMPMLGDNLPDPSECSLSLSDQEIIYARAWLWSRGYYKVQNSPIAFHKYLPNQRLLAKLVVGPTLWPGFTHQPPLELRVGACENCAREFLAVPINNRFDKRASERTLSSYLRVLKSMELLAAIGLRVPLDAIRSIDRARANAALDLKSMGRFNTVPHEIVMKALRSAIEFALEFGEDIVSGILSVYRASVVSGETLGTMSDIEFEALLTPKLRQAGVVTWSLQTERLYGRNALANTIDQQKVIYFRRFRGNEGLLEMGRVLYGAIAFTLGTLEARRSGEFLDLVAGNCLDTSRSRLVFQNRKSGPIGVRNIEARPIPPIGAEMVAMLERFQAELVRLGILPELTKLFSFPDRCSLVLGAATPETLNTALDKFCDYIEVPLNDDGKRYYIRPHQLRRFFAMTFFWSRAFGGMDTLRWFLGHTDIEHLYHYITESTPGEVLREIKADFAVNELRHGASETEALAKYLKKHFGCTDFSVLDVEEVREYVEMLLQEEKISVEPHFFDTPDGKQFRILVQVKRHSDYGDS